MPNLLKFERPRPKLKSKPPTQLSLLVNPQPPTVHRPIPNTVGDKFTPTAPTVGVNLSLREAIDYDALTPTQQAKWDAGLYGSIELKNRGIYQYYYLRWRDKNTGKYRSTYLGKHWNVAIGKLKLLTGH